MITPEQVTYLIKEKIHAPVTYLANTNLLNKNANAEKRAQGLPGTRYDLQGKMHYGAATPLLPGREHAHRVGCPGTGRPQLLPFGSRISHFQTSV